MKPLHTQVATILLTALGACAMATAQPESTIPVAAKTNGEKWWNGNCERIDRDIRKMEGKIDIAFVGDSITARWGNGENWQKHWGKYRAVNMGIGGDRTQNVLWRLQNGDLDGYEAKMFVVMIGTNNMWGKTPSAEDAAAGVKAVLDLIQSKQPKARILLMSILPTGEKPNPGRDVRAEVNKLICKFAGGQVEYVDIWDKYLDAKGMISKETMHDFLHLGSKGYDIWAESISGRVKEILGK